MATLGGGLGQNVISGGLDSAQIVASIPDASVITQADIDRMHLALASPERQVTLGGQTITYRSTSDLLLAINALQGMLNAQALRAAGVSPRPKRIYAYHGGRGFGRDCE